MHQTRQRKLSFYQEFNEAPVQPYKKWLYTIILFVGSLLAIIIIILNNHFADQYSDGIVFERFSNCSNYQCNENSKKLAIIIPIDEKTIYHFQNLTKYILNYTKESIDSKNTDLFIFPIGKSKLTVISYLSSETSELKNIFNDVEFREINNQIPTFDDLLLDIFNNSKTLLSKYCFFMYMSPKTIIYSDSWLDQIFNSTIRSNYQNFWIKTGIDMSLSPFTPYENIRLSKFGIYAAHSNCLSSLFEYAKEEHPTWELSKTLTNFVRSADYAALGKILQSKVQVVPYYIAYKADSTIETFPSTIFVEIY